MFPTIMSENFPLLIISTRHKTIDPGCSENTQQYECQNQTNTNKANPTRRHVTYNSQKHLMYRETKVRLTSNLPSDARKAGREWSEIFEVLREKKPMNLEFCTLQNHPSEVKKKIKALSDKQKLREPVSSRFVLQEILKEVFHRK